jgi:hypothetical protein
LSTSARSLRGIASEIWRLWTVFAAYLGAGLIGSGADSVIITVGVAAVSGTIRADGGALIFNRSRRLGRIFRLKIKIIDCREVVDSIKRDFSGSGYYPVCH